MLVILAGIITACASPSLTPSDPSFENVTMASSESRSPELVIEREDDVYELRLGTNMARARYSETKTDPDIPRVSAYLHVELEGEWEVLVEVLCRDHSRYCGLHPPLSEMSCLEKVADTSVRFEALQALHHQLGAQVSPVELLDTLGQKMPSPRCLESVNVIEVDLFLTMLPAEIHGIPEAFRDELDELDIPTLEQLWSYNRPKAYELIDQHIEALITRHPLDERQRFGIRFMLEQLRATSEGRYDIRDIQGPNGIIPGTLRYVVSAWTNELWALEDGAPHPAFGSSPEAEPEPPADLDRAKGSYLYSQWMFAYKYVHPGSLENLTPALHDQIASEIESGLVAGADRVIADQVFEVRSGDSPDGWVIRFVYHSDASDPDDALVFYLFDGTLYDRFDFSSTDDDKWPRPPLAFQ
ncbi:MAG: hypothetical protein ACNA8W_04465 [Bradymonadaceae bacterium]